MIKVLGKKYQAEHGDDFLMQIDEVRTYLAQRGFEFISVVNLSGELAGDPGHEEIFFLSVYPDDSWDHRWDDGNDDLVMKAMAGIVEQLNDQFMPSAGDHAEWVGDPIYLNNTIILPICRGK